MVKYKNLVLELIQHKETEWLEFKHNWFDPRTIGEYISALSNSACLRGRNFAYIVWGVSDLTHEFIGTDIDYLIDINGEPFEHYLARQLTPSIAFAFHKVKIEEKNILLLEIPKANGVPTSFNKERFIRIGSSKEKLSKFPEREAQLWSVLSRGQATVTNTISEFQSLEFNKLIMYYGSKGIKLNLNTFQENLHLKTRDGLYNVLGRILADNNGIPVRVSMFSGRTKTDKLFSVKEYGNTCILYAMDKILELGEIINIVQADERNRVVERNDVPFFNQEAFREAIVNAFVHNNWLEGNAPMVSVFSDRIEILSHGGLPANQTIEGFFSGSSKPVNEQLATIFLQLRISERSGRGVPKVVEAYGKEAYTMEDNSIKVTIPFNRIGVVDFQIDYQKVEGKVDGKVQGKLNATQKKMLLELRDNPNITIPQLASKLKQSEASINKNIKILKDNGNIQRIGADKNGYWEVK